MPGLSKDTARPASTSSSRKPVHPAFRSTRRIVSTARPATSRTRPRTSTGWSRKAGEDRIIPICRLLAGTGLAAAAFLAVTPAAARVEAVSPLLPYAEARMAALQGANDQASRRYAAAFAAAPADQAIATQAMRHAVIAGNWRLALDGARALERQNALPIDARFLLTAEAFRAHDWRAARAQIDAIERDQSIGFTVPVLRAWLAFGAHEGDPLAALSAAGANGPAAGYAAEHRALLLVALGRPEGQVEMLAAARSAGPRGV